MQVLNVHGAVACGENVHGAVLNRIEEAKRRRYHLVKTANC